MLIDSIDLNARNGMSEREQDRSRHGALCKRFAEKQIVKLIAVEAASHRASTSRSVPQCAWPFPSGDLLSTDRDL